MLEFYLRNGVRIVFLLLLAIIATGSAALAQDPSGNTRRGIVLDDYGNPLEGVSVVDESTGLVVMSDEKGFFEITANDGGKLIFKHPGFYSYVLPVKAGVKDIVEVQLVESYLKNPDKMEVLYGTVEKGKSAGAVSTVYTNQLTTSISTNYASSLAGRLPGLYVQQNRGIRATFTDVNTRSALVGGRIPTTNRAVPGDNTMYGLSLRGQGPVTIIDGIQRDIYSIDPANIESVSVQKDALSSILLGMRSSRGTVLVTTRKPSGKGFQLSFTGESGVQRPLKMPRPLSGYQYAYLLNEALQNIGEAPAYTAADFEAYRNGENPFTHPDVDWYSTVYKESAPISSFNLNASGGGKVARYSVSFNYLNQEGHFKTLDLNSYQTNIELDRYLFTSNIDIDVTDDLQMSLNLFGRIQEGVQPGAGTSTILNNMYATPNNAYPIYNPDGSYGGSVTFTTNLYQQALNSGYIQDNSRDIMANIDLDYDLSSFVKGLSAKAITNISVQNLSAIIRNKRSIVYQYRPADEVQEERYSFYGSNSPQSNSFNYVGTSRFWYGQLSLNYNTFIGKHEISGKLFGDKRIISPNFDLPARYNNLAAQAKYNYAGKYFAEAAVDFGSFNRYPTDQQWGTFYAFGLGWDLSKESFLRQLDWLNQLKVRGVYGKTGNADMSGAGYYTWRQTYNEYIEGYRQGYSRSPGPGIEPTNNTLANPDITWEKADKLSAGVDVALFNNHLQLTGDYFYDTYYDLLQSRGKSIALLGINYPAENIGENLYKGVELSLSYQNNIGSFNYFFTGNWSQMETEILDMDEQLTEYPYNRHTGNPVGTIFGLQADGFFDSLEEIEGAAVFEGVPVQPGDIRYKDLNNDGVIDSYDQTAIGNTKPLSFYGLTAGFNVKGFDFSLLFQGAYNRDLYLGDRTLQAGFQQMSSAFGQAYQNIVGRWTPETAETATYPRLTAGRSQNNAPDQWTSFYVESGNYIRLKNISLGYTLPYKWTGRHGVSAVRLFLNVQNAWTKSATKLVDPEVVAFGNYPIQRVISGGINIKL